MFDVIIIGGGVAGFSASLFCARRGLDVLVLGKDIGGQANYTDQIENFPGQAPVGGYELINSIKKQAESFGAKFLNAEVSKIKPAAGSFLVTAYGKQYKAKSLILAYGKTPRDLGVPGENELKGRGISYCANCDAPLYKNKIVAIAGTGDLAADATLLCAKYAKKVYVLSKIDKLVAHPGLVKVMLRKKNVTLVPFVQIQQIIGENQVSALGLINLKTGQHYDLPLDAVLVELGYVVDSQIVQNIVKLDEQEQILVAPNQATSVPGIFAAGDATNRLYKQAVISAGEGATAALACFDYLMRQAGKQGLTSDWTQIKRVK